LLLQRLAAQDATDGGDPLADALSWCDDSSSGALFAAAANDHHLVLRLLLEAGAPGGLRDSDGRTVLQAAGRRQARAPPRSRRMLGEFRP